MTAGDPYDHDLAWTRTNRARLFTNRNLLLWYRELYRLMLRSEETGGGRTILEIGSGTSPLKLFFPEVITSDVLRLDYLDHSFDCLEIDRFSGLADASVDVITMTNVLHHLSDPLAFLRRAAVKLRPGGKLICAEPYFSRLSRLVYRHLHHEPADFAIVRPLLDVAAGPLSSANMAIPHMIFIEPGTWSGELNDTYSFSRQDVQYFSALSYMATGGISRRLPLPHRIYRRLLVIDLWLARRFPRACAAFFVATLEKRGGTGEPGRGGEV
jgi:SAM-dependent methyltransferase